VSGARRRRCRRSSASRRPHREENHFRRYLQECARRRRCRRSESKLFRPLSRKVFRPGSRRRRAQCERRKDQDPELRRGPNLDGHVRAAGQAALEAGRGKDRTRRAGFPPDRALGTDRPGRDGSSLPGSTALVHRPGSFFMASYRSRSRGGRCGLTGAGGVGCGSPRRQYSKQVQSAGVSR
jgi:hypothetical protein